MVVTWCLFDLSVLLVALRFGQFVLDSGIWAGACKCQWFCSEARVNLQSIATSKPKNPSKIQPLSFVTLLFWSVSKCWAKFTLVHYLWTSVKRTEQTNPNHFGVLWVPVGIGEEHFKLQKWLICQQLILWGKLMLLEQMGIYISILNEENRFFSVFCRVFFWSCDASSRGDRLVQRQCQAISCLEHSVAYVWILYFVVMWHFSGREGNVVIVTFKPCPKTTFKQNVENLFPQLHSLFALKTSLKIMWH